MKSTSPLKKPQLDYFNSRLEEQRVKLQSQIESLSAEDPFANPDHVSDNAAIDTDVREQLGHDTIEAEIKTLSTRLELTNQALEKIAKGNYGICEKSGLPIPTARLELIPEARFRIEFEPKATAK